MFGHQGGGTAKVTAIPPKVSASPVPNRNSITEDPCDCFYTARKEFNTGLWTPRGPYHGPAPVAFAP